MKHIKEKANKYCCQPNFAHLSHLSLVGGCVLLICIKECFCEFLRTLASCVHPFFFISVAHRSYKIARAYPDQFISEPVCLFWRYKVSPKCGSFCPRFTKVTRTVLKRRIAKIVFKIPRCRILDHPERKFVWNVLSNHVVLALPNYSQALFDQPHTLFHISWRLGVRPCNRKVGTWRIRNHPVHAIGGGYSSPRQCLVRCRSRCSPPFGKARCQSLYLRKDVISSYSSLYLCSGGAVVDAVNAHRIG